MKELPKIYDPKQVESKIYRYWTDGGWFHAERDPDKKPFTIVIPPPNVTGQLHLGHAFDETDPGRAHPLEAHERVLRAVAAGR